MPSAEARPDHAVSLRGRRRIADPAFRYVSTGAGLFVLLVLALIAYSTTKEAWPVFREEGLGFLTQRRWAVNEEIFGALGFIVGTLLSSLVALVLAVPVSIGIALFVTEVAPERLKKPTIYLMDLLAVIPSVVFGLWGFNVLAPRLKGPYTSVSDALGNIPLLGRLFAGPVQSGYTIFTAGIILAIMITPIVSSLAREVFATVPRGDKEGALALGATRWEMIRGAVFPHSRTGLTGAVMLGLGRAMGETIAVALVIGGAVPQVSARLFAASDSMPAVIARQWGEAEGLHRAALIGLGVMLFVITVVINLSANAIVTRANRRSAGA
ncbi:MAG: phosphate ABC transporter permease subunit PstC [Acidimicrobiia bacterium]